MKNRKLRDSLVEIIKEAGAEQGTSKATGALLCEVANKVRLIAAVEACCSSKA